jgi:hypothetical protein
MSDTGLHSSIYEQLRSYADGLDRALVALRDSQAGTAQQARREIVALLRELTDKDTTDPAARLVTAILKQGLPSVTGQGLALCDALARTLEQRAPNTPELNQLEQIALTLDKECSSTLARIKGKR